MALLSFVVVVIVPHHFSGFMPHVRLRAAVGLAVMG